MVPAASTPARFLRCELIGANASESPVLGELMGLAIVLIVLQTAAGMFSWSGLFHFELGADLLFILVGLGVGASPPPPDARAFLVRELGALLLPYWLVLTAYWACNTHFLQLHYTAGNLALHYLDLQGGFGDASALAINAQFGLITALGAFFACYGLAQAWLKAPDRLLLAGAIISVPFAFGCYLAGQSASYGSIAQPLPGLVLGLLLGRLLRDGTIEFRLGLVLGLAAFLQIYVPYTRGIVFNPPVAGLSLMVAYVFAWKPLAAPIPQKWMARILGFLGIYWVEILLLHEPLIREYNYYLHGRWFGIASPTGSTLGLGLAAGLGLTLLVGLALHWFVLKILSFLSPAA